MNLNQRHIKKINLVGWDSDGSEIYHIETKGGHHSLVRKTAVNGEYKILGYGSSRGHAKVMADKCFKNVKWRDDLYKNEEKDTSQTFSYEDYIQQAKWYAKKMQQESNLMRQIHYGLKSAQFLKAAKGWGVEDDTVNKIFERINLQKNETDLSGKDKMLIAFYELEFGRPFPDLIEGSN